MMSELLLYIIATAVVLAGVAYFFVKQREQEAKDANTANSRGRAKKSQKTKKEKEPREEKESKPKRTRVPKEEPAPVAAVPLTKKQLRTQAKEEDETRGVLDFLKGKKFSSDSGEKGTQAKVRTAPAAEKKAAPQPKKNEPAAVESESESSSSDEEGTGYITIKRKPNTPKDPKETTPSADTNPPPKPKKKFFLKAEKEAYLAEQAAKKADYDARKNRPPGEKRERRPRKAEGGEGEADGEFQPAYRERKPRKERIEGQEGQEGEGEEGEGRKKYPPREPAVAPGFDTAYETTDMDSILNGLTSYYASHPDANVSKPKSKPRSKAPEAEAAEPEVTEAASTKQ